MKVASECLDAAGMQYSLTTLDQADYYCRPDIEIICYYGFQVLDNGAPIRCKATADGRQIECPLLLVVKYAPN